MPLPVAMVTSMWRLTVQTKGTISVSGRGSWRWAGCGRLSHWRARCQHTQVRVNTHKWGCGNCDTLSRYHPSRYHPFLDTIHWHDWLHTDNNYYANVRTAARWIWDYFWINAENSELSTGLYFLNAWCFPSTHKVVYVYRHLLDRFKPLIVWWHSTFTIEVLF